MTRIVLDPDEVNQDEVVTLTDGEVVVLADADRATLDRIARQLHIHRSSYAHALVDPGVEDRVASGELPVDDHSPLYLKVAALQASARQGHRRAPRSLDLDLLWQDRVWTSSSGSTSDLVSLTPTHRRNLVAWLERTSEELRERAEQEWPPERLREVGNRSPWVAGTPLHRRLSLLMAAESSRERAMDEARQIARTLEFERSGDWPDQ